MKNTVIHILPDFSFPERQNRRLTLETLIKCDSSWGFLADAFAFGHRHRLTGAKLPILKSHYRKKPSGAWSNLFRQIS
jgi:hypothetical protein